MKYTQEKLSKMSDHEINCAVADKLGFTVKNKWKDGGIIILDIKINGNTHVKPVDYCSNPNDYMPIAIENNITIDFVGNNVCAIWTKPSVNHDKYYENDYIGSGDMRKNKTGRAVCVVFLLLEIKQ